MLSETAAFDIVRDALASVGVDPETVSMETKIEDVVGKPGMNNVAFAGFCGAIEEVTGLEFDDRTAGSWGAVRDAVDWLVQETARSNAEPPADDELRWPALV